MDLFALWFLVILYTATTAVYIFDLYVTYKKDGGLTMGFYCKAMYLLVEALVPLIIIGGYTLFDKTYDRLAIVDFSNEGIMGLLYYWILSVLGYIALHFGINANYRFTYSGRKLKPKPPQDYPTSLMVTGYLALIVGVVCLFLWSKAYGGILELIEVANKVRGGWSEIVNPLAFFKHPASLCMIASYTFFTMFCTRRKKLWLALSLVVSVVFSVLYLLATDGRLFAGFYFLTMVVIYVRCRAITKGKTDGRRLLLLLVFAAAMVVLMMKMNDITEFIRTGKWVNSAGSVSLLDMFINEFTFILSSGQYTIMNSDKIGGWQFFNDLGYGLFAWLPTALKPEGFSSIWKINTNLLGFLENGTIPFDIITQGYYDLRLLGVVLFPFCLGRVIRLIDTRCAQTPMGTVVFSTLFYVMTRAIPYGEMYDFVLGLFGLAVFYVIYKAVTLFLVRKKQ